MRYLSSNEMVRKKEIKQADPVFISQEAWGQRVRSRDSSDGPSAQLTSTVLFPNELGDLVDAVHRVQSNDQDQSSIRSIIEA